MSRTKVPTSFRLSQRAHRLMERLSTHYGLSKTGVIELLLRNHAREIGMLSGPEKIDGGDATASQSHDASGS